MEDAISTTFHKWITTLPWRAWTPVRWKLPFFGLTFAIGTVAALGFEPAVLVTSIGAVYAGAVVRRFSG